MTNVKVIRWCSAALITILIILALWPNTCEGQWRIDDPELYPITITMHCGECDPTSKIETVGFVLQGAVKNWYMCDAFGRNEWGNGASDFECGRGQVKVVNDFGDIGFYYHTGVNPEKRTGMYVLMFFTPAKTFEWGGCYRLLACRSDKYRNEDAIPIPE